MTYLSNCCDSLHTGKNKQGLDFSESYPSFDSTVMKAYSEFLDSKYCKSLFVENKDTDQALDKLNEDSSAIWEKIGSDEGNNLDGMEDGMDNDNDDGDGEDDGDNDGPTNGNEDKQDDTGIDGDGEEDDDRDKGNVDQLSNASGPPLYTQPFRTGQMLQQLFVKRLLRNVLQRSLHNTLH